MILWKTTFELLRDGLGRLLDKISMLSVKFSKNQQHSARGAVSVKIQLMPPEFHPVVC